MGAPFATTRGYVRERVLEELYRRPGEFLSTQQLTALIDEADTSADIASICFDLKRTQRLCTGQKVMGANGIPANTWGLSDGERADLERRRPDLAALMAPKGKGQASGAKAKGNGKGHDPAPAKVAKGKAAKAAATEGAGVKPGLTTAGGVKPAEAETPTTAATAITPAKPATVANPATVAPAVALADADLDALGLPAAAPRDDPLPLPTESHEDERPLPAPAKTGCGGQGACGGHCANHERDSLRQQLDEQETRLDDLAQAEATAVELESALAAAREEVEVTQAALREAQENLKQVREDLGAQLDGRNTLVAEQREHIDDLLTERAKHFDELAAKNGALKDALTEIAALESFRDSFLGILEDRDARLAEAQRRIDALMLAVRPHLGASRDPEPGQPAGPEATAPRHLPAAGLASAPTWHVNLASEPFSLPRVPKDWVGELSLRLLDERDASLKFKVDSEGGGAYCQFKADAIIDHSGADFVPGLANGLIKLMDYLFPHLAGDWPPAAAGQAVTENSHTQNPASPRAVQAPAAEVRP